MKVSEFVANLSRQGVQLQVNNDKLSVNSPKGVITPELRTELADRKSEILTFLQEIHTPNNFISPLLPQGITLSTIGQLIGGSANHSVAQCKQPVIEPLAMAKKLTVTFRPLPKKYQNQQIIKFREELETKLREYGVNVEPWQTATTDFRYDFHIPLTRWKTGIKTRLIKTGIDAVIDVERPASIINKAETIVAEQIYQLYSRFMWKNQPTSVTKIAKLTIWAEDRAAKYVQDPMGTQIITIAEINKDLANPQVSYQTKIPIGLNTLIKTFSEMVIGVANDKISILNMNLSDSTFSRDKVDHFVLNSLIPKVFVPIAPLLLNQFQIEEYEPAQSNYAVNLVELGKKIAETNLLPPGSKLSEVVKRKSHRDIVNILVNGRTGVSYGFVAYAEPPQYIGAPEISEDEWNNLLPTVAFNNSEVRQNSIGRRYLKTKIGEDYVFKQIPDIWLVSSRSGSNKTNLNLETDVLRIGLQDKLLLQVPKGIDLAIADIKPSYDVYVMLGIALSAALYTPELVKNGAPIVHFHGYPHSDWFLANEYCTGVNNPSVPCGTYESGVFNFLGVYQLAKNYSQEIALAALIEPDHGTNIIAPDLDYLVERLKSGCAKGQIELGGKHFSSLKPKVSTK